MWLPCGRYVVAREKAKAKEGFERKIKSKRKNQLKDLPEKGWREDTILNRIKQGSEESKQYFTNGGKMSAAVFSADDDHWDFISEVMRATIESNPLRATEFSSISQMEAEIIKVTLNLFHGSEGSCGLLTSGGTESIILAMLACREWGRKERGIQRPNIVVPVTAHGAFNKACFLFDIELRRVNLSED